MSIRSRVSWYVAFGAVAVAAIAGSSVTVNGDLAEVDPDSPASTVSSSPDALPSTVSAAPTIATDAPPAATTTVTLAPPATRESTTPIADALTMVEVTDAAGELVVRLPATFQLDTQPVTIDGVALRHVSGSSDLTRYLGGDVSLLGATVLTGRTADVGAPMELLAEFSAGTSCEPSLVEQDVAVAFGTATVLSFDDCRPSACTDSSGCSMVLVAGEATAWERIVFVGVQSPGRSDVVTRPLALAIIDSVRPA